MWESPITKIEGDIAEQVVKYQEDQLMLTIQQEMGFNIDKQELIRALQYDRDQYTKGYNDCKADMLAKVKQAMEEIENLSGQSCMVSDGVINEALDILDKLIAESEG